MQCLLISRRSKMSVIYPDFMATAAPQNIHRVPQKQKLAYIYIYIYIYIYLYMYIYTHM